MKNKLLLALIMVVLGTIIFGMMTVSAEKEGSLTYTISGGEATITKCSILAMGKLTIPNTLGGYPVTAIGDRAFADCITLSSITIPNSVTTIGNNAFSHCLRLTDITIPDSVTTIGVEAFSYCTSLTSITVNSGNTKYSSLSGVLFDKNQKNILCYPAGRPGKYYTIPDSVTTIGEYAFQSCEGLTDITIPDSVTTIGNNAYESCKGLTSITIPNNIKSIGEEVFVFCTGLTSIDVHSGNSTYSSLSGVLFDKNKTTLICYPAGKSETNYTIPKSVTTIGDWAFSSCTGLTKITISHGVTTIGEDAFYNCAGLATITIPDSVTTIEKYAFYGCEGLTDVFYYGTEETWSTISIGAENEPLKNATLHINAYTINSITIRDGAGNALSAIPQSNFLATVSVTSVKEDGDNVVVFAQYSKAGTLDNLMYVSVEDVPQGATFKFTFPVNNTAGNVEKLKAFVWESLGSAMTLGNTITFPAE